MTLSVRVPQLVPPSLNHGGGREHWAARARRVAKERMMVRLALSVQSRPKLPLLVTLTRCAPRQLDSDNAVGALKAVRDEVAAWLGVDDRDERIEWVVAQSKVPKIKQGTLIQFDPR